MLREAMSCMVKGEPRIGRLLLHDYAEAVIGFDELSLKTGKQRDDLEHMLSGEGDPLAEELLGIVAAVAKHEGIALDVQVVPRGHYGQQAASLIWHQSACDNLTDCDNQHS